MPTYEDSFQEWAKAHGFQIRDHAWDFAAWMHAFHPTALDSAAQRMKDYAKAKEPKP